MAKSKVIKELASNEISLEVALNRLLVIGKRYLTINPINLS